jgi:serum/glucocorticoid-regulated kinase 2
MGACWSCCRDCLDLAPPINPDRVDLTHFELHRVLGRGGFGKVQVAQSRLSGAYYALKSISKAWLIQSSSNVQSVWLERHIMIQIRSPFLVPVYFAFQDRTHIYLVMHFLPGGDLHFLLHNKRILAAKGVRHTGSGSGHNGRKAALPEWHAQFYMAEILLALEEMHSFGLVYRDLKPENVYVARTQK